MSLRDGIEIVVTDPRGLRAAVSYPPFTTAVPIVGSSVLDCGTARADVDCSRHPGAAALLADPRSGDTLLVEVLMLAHPTGNGYVILRLGRVGAAPDVEVALDPVVHAEVLAAIIDSGQLLLVDVGRGSGPVTGWAVTVDSAAVRAKTTAALTHPRRVRLLSPF